MLCYKKIWMVLALLMVSVFASTNEKSFNYSFSYPKSWKMIETPNAGVYLLAPKTEVEDFRPNIIVQVKPANKKDSLNYYSRSFENSLKENNSSADIETIKTENIAGKNSQSIDYFINRAGSVIQGRAYLFEIEDRVMIINCTANDLQFEKIAPVFENIVDSFASEG
jgi:hypothetical protein